MNTINLIAIDHAQGFPVIGNLGRHIHKGIEEGLLEQSVRDLGYPYTVIRASDNDEIQDLLHEHMNPDTVVLSRDHMMTYFGLSSARYDPERFCLIVLDQHLDIYSYHTHGEYLNKANALRYSHDRGLLPKVYIVGVRESEEREFDDFHLMFIPDYWSVVKNKRYAGMEDVITVVPMREIHDLEKTLEGIVDEIRADGFETVGLDIDLDGFRSDLITGVQFNESFPDLVRREIGDMSADFISGQLLEDGLPIERIEEQISETCGYIRGKGLGLVYRGITEYEPESDTGGLTGQTVGRLLRAFNNHV